jgi:plastocyanin
MSKRLAAILLSVVLLASLGAGCKKKKRVLSDDEEGGGGSKKPTVQYVSKKDEGTIQGTINFDGAAPQAPPLDPSGDAFCNASMSDKIFDYYKIKDGKLADVLVYVTGNNIETLIFPTLATPVVLDQQGCRYHPRMLGVMTGQKFLVRNSDGTNHNVHPSPKNNAGFNQSQPAKASDIEKTFDTPEEKIPVKCDLHPWMTARITVFNHPCFAVTRDDGSYSISGVPPGNYNLVFWHEKLGTLQVPIKVDPNGTVTQNMVFKQSGGGPAPAMKVGEPLIVPHIR